MIDVTKLTATEIEALYLMFDCACDKCKELPFDTIRKAMKPVFEDLSHLAMAHSKELKSLLGTPTGVHVQIIPSAKGIEFVSYDHPPVEPPLSRLTVTWQAFVDFLRSKGEVKVPEVIYKVVQA